jgi:hypothetical protein
MDPGSSRDEGRRIVIVFLDFDGVLHPFFPWRDLADQENQLIGFLPRFESVIRAFPIARIVIASDWRRHHSLTELREFFSPDIRDRRFTLM